MTPPLSYIKALNYILSSNAFAEEKKRSREKEKKLPSQAEVKIRRKKDEREANYTKMALDTSEKVIINR